MRAASPRTTVHTKRAVRHLARAARTILRPAHDSPPSIPQSVELDQATVNAVLHTPMVGFCLGACPVPAVAQDGSIKVLPMAARASSGTHLAASSRDPHMRCIRCDSEWAPSSRFVPSRRYSSGSGLRAQLLLVGHVQQ
jgi:hypothetical protein